MYSGAESRFHLGGHTFRFCLTDQDWNFTQICLWQRNESVLIILSYLSLATSNTTPIRTRVTINTNIRMARLSITQ